MKKNKRQANSVPLGRDHQNPSSQKTLRNSAAPGVLAAGSATPVFDGSKLVNIKVIRGDKTYELPGKGGTARELAFLPSNDCFSPGSLPVLIGAGSGAALEALVPILEKQIGPDFPLAVVDKEEDILAASGLRERFAHHPGIVFISNADPGAAVSAMTKWQDKHRGLPLHPLENPFYLRIDRDYYSAVRDACRASREADFWSKTAYPRFQSDKPRILLITSRYFLIGEIIAACQRMEIPHKLISISDGEFAQTEFVENMLSDVIDFKPDFVFTINHLGVDREGVLAHLLERLRLPLASWFVDNPHLVLYLYNKLVNPWTAIFTWDVDNIPSLKKMGFEHVEYLPLGVDEKRFSLPAPGFVCPANWTADVSFVGNSMVSKVSSRLNRLPLAPDLAQSYPEVARGFAEANHRSVFQYLQEFHPGLVPSFNALPSVEDKLGYEAMITWEATRQYRFSCVSATLDFTPLFVGDEGWKEILPKNGSWRYHPELSYYTDLPGFYPCSAINFNCTSKQMKGAVNQRVFDVPATGSFLLTDYREQVENLFEPGREIACYHSPEEAKDMIARYLAAPEERRKLTQTARKRILAEHTYEHRLATLVLTMKKIFG